MRTYSYVSTKYFFLYQTCLSFSVDVYFFNKPVSIFLRSYNTALVSVCDSGLLGIIILLITSAVSGFLFTTLVWCNSHTWIYFKHKGRYIKVRMKCTHTIFFFVKMMKKNREIELLCIPVFLEAFVIIVSSTAKYL